MKCPVCKSRMYVHEMENHGLETQRTYECPVCMTRFQTVEKLKKFLYKQEKWEEKDG